jgi:hypothetical protein
MADNSNNERPYLSERANAAERERRRQIEVAVRTRGEIERVADQQSPGRPVKTVRPPI